MCTVVYCFQPKQIHLSARETILSEEDYFLLHNFKVCIISHLNQGYTLSLGNYSLPYLSHVKSQLQAVLNCYFVAIMHSFDKG